MFFPSLITFETRVALALIALEDALSLNLGIAFTSPRVRFAVRVAATIIVGLFLTLLAIHAWGSDGTEFSDATTTFTGWAKGNPGKIVAILGVLWGSTQAVFKKDVGAVALPAGLGVAVGAIVGVINASYTATV
ncbi:hypothetical protein [Burkholderia glumae]|uniref:hypothetical protein n=1 Tax=Burkholderia glumae TaxID=337 RepID=UPI000427322D|nr:hypothetical protein [Burkholderia glumae]QKM57656.1 hypothetical protein CG017_05735 [Burkholderia glumae]